MLHLRLARLRQESFLATEFTEDTEEMQMGSIYEEPSVFNFLCDLGALCGKKYSVANRFSLHLSRRHNRHIAHAR